jgi:hypothetical protein
VLVGCAVGTISWPAWPAGLLCLVLGSLLHLWTKGVLEQNRRLTTAGPYRWTRNPFYLANLLIDGGLCLVIGRWWVAAIFLPLWGWTYRDTILREEARLSALFGEDFARYRAAVPRFVPAIRSWPASLAVGRFRWSSPNLAQGAEYARLLGVWLGPGAIWAAACLRREGGQIFAVEHRLELGGILLLASVWILKLALAEASRRPESALLPRSVTPGVRALVAIGLFLPGWLASAWEPSSSGTWSGALLLGCLATIGRPQGEGAGRGRIVLHVAAAVAVVGFGILSRTLWLATLPTIWLGLGALDEWGRMRWSRRGRGTSRSTWAWFPRIAAACGATGFALVAVVSWMR